MTAPDQRSIEAARWDARLRSPDCSEADRAAFELWKSDASNAATLSRLHDALTLLGRGRGHKPAVETAKASTGWPRRFALAASLALAGIAIAVVTPFGRREQFYAAPTASSRSLLFEDGSHIEIDPGSALNIQYSGHERSITLLRGKASFSVEPDTARPFVVHAGDRRVTARATVFDMRLTAVRVHVGLRKGTADVHCWHGLFPSEVTLRAGDALDAEIGSDRATRTTGTI